MHVVAFQGSRLADMKLFTVESQSHSSCRWWRWFRPAWAAFGDDAAADAPSSDRRPPIGRSRQRWRWRRSFLHRQAAPLISSLPDMLLLFVVLLPAACASSNILLRISGDGLQQSEHHIRQLLDREIPRLRVPAFTETFDEGPGYGKVTITKVIAKQFTAPLIKFLPSADGLLHLRTAWGKAEADADFNVTYRVLSVVPVPFGGRINAKAEGLTSNIVVRVDVVNKKPAFKVTACSTKIEKFDLSLSGGFVASIMDLFKAALSRRISAALEHEFCKGAETKFADYFRDRLADILVDITLNKEPNITLTYDLEKVHISEEKMDVLVEAAVEWDGVRLTPSPAAGKEPFPVGRVPKSSRMIDLYIKESVFQSALSGAHYSGFFDKDIGENNTFLETTCEGLCIGAFAPPLERLYPNRRIGVHVSTTDAPVVSFATGRPVITVAGKVIAYLLPNNASDQPVVEANISADIVMNLGVRKNNLTARVEIQNATMLMTGSNDGIFDESTLNFLIDLTVPFLEDVTDTYLSRGVRLPAPFDWEYENSKLTIVDKFARFESDVVVFV